MAITPTTNLKLLKVPISIDNKNQITFINKEAQFEYFNSLSSIEYENFNYQRKDSVIRFPAHIDSIIEYNYCIYQNENYSDKWFYCFITDMKYVNDGLTEITIKTDVFQTWQFDLIYKNMFVEREHVSDDTIGNHTLDENLNTGDYIEDAEYEDFSLKDYFVAIECDWLIKDDTHGDELLESHKGTQFSGISVYNKQISGSKIILFKVDFIEQYSYLGNYIKRTNLDGHINDLHNIFIIPKALIDEKFLVEHTAYANLDSSVLEDSFTFYTMLNSNEVKKYNIDIDKLYNFTDFLPKNKKCYVYPYNFLQVTNNVGNIINYKYEDFSGEKANFIVELSLNIGVSGKLTPLNYKRKTRDDDESITLGKFPTCSWSSDAFINWLTQESVNQATNIAFGLVGGMPNYNTSEKSLSSNINIGTNIASTISNQIGNFYSGALMPNNTGGNNNSNVTWATGKNTYTFRCLRVKKEYLKIIDDFFSMYGYKVNNVKIPNIIGRKNWNYVKTLGSNIEGDIPQNDLQEIKNMFDNGVTFWHNSNTFLDYSQENNIL